MNNAGGEVNNAKVVAASDARWFSSVLQQDLFEAAADSPWLGDPRVWTLVRVDKLMVSHRDLAALLVCRCAQRSRLATT